MTYFQISAILTGLMIVFFSSLFFLSLFGMYLVSEHAHFVHEHKKGEDFIEYEERSFLSKYDAYTASIHAYRSNIKEKFQKVALITSKVFFVFWIRILHAIKRYTSHVVGFSTQEIESRIGSFFFHNYEDYKKRMRRFKKKLQEESSQKE